MFLNRKVDKEIPEVVWQAVEMKDASTVQRGTEPFASTVAQKTVAINTIRTDRAIAFASGQPQPGQSMGRSPYTSDDITGVCSVTMSLSSTQITMDRNNTASSCDVGWFVVEFAKRRAVVVGRRRVPSRSTHRRHGPAVASAAPDGGS